MRPDPLIPSASAYLAVMRDPDEPKNAGHDPDHSPRLAIHGVDPPMTSPKTFINGDDKSFIPALKALIDRVRTGWVVATIIVSFVGHMLVSLVMNGWIMSPAKTADLDALSLRIEATSTSTKAELSRQTAEIKTIENQNLALGNLIATQTTALARLEEGMRGVHARLDDWRSQPQVIKAGSPSVPPPPPHYHQKANKKAGDGVLGIFTPWH